VVVATTRRSVGCEEAVIVLGGDSIGAEKGKLGCAGGEAMDSVSVDVAVVLVELVLFAYKVAEAHCDQRRVDLVGLAGCMSIITRVR
jgi:hypothetical protein